MEVWLGNAVCMFPLAPELLSVLQDAYTFVADARGRRLAIPSSVRLEMELVRRLVFVIEAEVGAPIWRE
eukprot:796287-Pyramimonas_sp.AAC.1